MRCVGVLATIGGIRVGSVVCCWDVMYVDVLCSIEGVACVWYGVASYSIGSTMVLRVLGMACVCWGVI